MFSLIFFTKFIEFQNISGRKLDDTISASRQKQSNSGFCVNAYRFMPPQLLSAALAFQNDCVEMIYRIFSEQLIFYKFISVSYN